MSGIAISRIGQFAGRGIEMDTWPEEGAALTHETYCHLRETDGEGYANEWLQGQIAHMHRVFDDLADIQRYDDKLNELLGK
jgi:hypothetical protein